MSLVSLLKLLGAMSGMTCCLRLAEGLSVKLLLVIRGLDLRSVELPVPSWEAGADIGLSEASLGSDARKLGLSEKSCATYDWSVVSTEACDWSAVPG